MVALPGNPSPRPFKASCSRRCPCPFPMAPPPSSVPPRLAPGAREPPPRPRRVEPRPRDDVVRKPRLAPSTTTKPPTPGREPPSSALIPLRRAGAQPRNAVSAAPWPTDAPATPTSWSFAKRRGCDTNLALTTRVAPSPRARHPRAHPRRASASTSSHHDDAVVRNVGRDPATPR